MKLFSKIAFSITFILIIILRISSTYVSQHTVNSTQLNTETMGTIETSISTKTYESPEVENENLTLKTIAVYNSELNREISIDEFNRMEIDGFKSFSGIGDVIALAIQNHIQEFGPFSSFEQLIEVKGIGEKKLQKILGNLP